jgi:hypothetical protein
MAVLIIGGSGFVGSNLTKHLLSKKLNVIVYIHQNFGFLDNFENISLKYIRNFEELASEKEQIDCIYHCASIIRSKRQAFEYFYESNVRLTLEVISLVKKLNIKQLVYVSTASIFSGPEKAEIFNEDSIPNPSSYYGLTKYISEKILYTEFKNTDIKVSIVRFPSIFGRNNLDGIVKLFYDNAISHKDIELFSLGQRLRNLIYIDSVVDVLYKIYRNIKKLTGYEIFMAGSSNSLKLVEIANEIITLTESDSKIILTEKTLSYDFDVIIDIAKAQKLLDFKPFSIEEGLKKYVEVARK